MGLRTGCQVYFLSMSTRFFTNHGDQTLLRKFRGIFENNPDIERLALLMELRQFRQQHPEQFRRIKGLPLRARVGRADPPRANGTVTFIRSHRRDAFYRVRPNSEIEEIALLEAAREFRALDPAEKAIPLHAAHHEHVNSALDAFKEAVTTDALQSQTVDAAQGPNERKALQYLDSFLSLPFVSEEERLLILAAQAAIRRGRFQNLQRQVNQLYRSTKDVKLTPSALADKLMQILRTYPLDAPSPDGPSAPVQLRPLDTTPEIILSESFDHPPPA